MCLNKIHIQILGGKPDHINRYVPYFVYSVNYTENHWNSFKMYDLFSDVILAMLFNSQIRVKLFK